MQSISNSNFGPLIAYLVPGATALWGISYSVPAVRTWFATTSGDPPTIGGFLYLTIASIACGMVVTAIRWASVDSLHRLTGLSSRPLDFEKLHGRVDAFNLLIEIHYRHYQFYANMAVATLIAFGGYRFSVGWSDYFGVLEGVFLTFEAIFISTSRDTLNKYYRRTEQLLGTLDHSATGDCPA